MDSAGRKNDALLRRRAYEAYARAYAGTQLDIGMDEKIKEYAQEALCLLSELENPLDEDREMCKAVKSLQKSK